MAGQRQPTDLVVMKGKKHLTKAEIEARKNAEVVAPNDKVNGDFVETFNKIRNTGVPFCE